MKCYEIRKGMKWYIYTCTNACTHTVPKDTQATVTLIFLWRSSFQATVHLTTHTTATTTAIIAATTATTATTTTTTTIITAITTTTTYYYCYYFYYYYYHYCYFCIIIIIILFYFVIIIIVVLLLWLAFRNGKLNTICNDGTCLKIVIKPDLNSNYCKLGYLDDNRLLWEQMFSTLLIESMNIAAVILAKSIISIAQQKPRNI